MTLRDISALTTIASGIGLCIASFCINAGEIADSVLWYFGECLLYGGAIYNVELVTLRQIRKAMREKFKVEN